MNDEDAHPLSGVSGDAEICRAPSSSIRSSGRHTGRGVSLGPKAARGRAREPPQGEPHAGARGLAPPHFRRADRVRALARHDDRRARQAAGARALCLWREDALKGRPRASPPSTPRPRRSPRSCRVARAPGPLGASLRGGGAPHRRFLTTPFTRRRITATSCSRCASLHASLALLPGTTFTAPGQASPPRARSTAPFSRRSRTATPRAPRPPRRHHIENAGRIRMQMMFEG